jgi:hypothetical protein
MIVLDGNGAITGLTATGISAVQQLPAGSVIQVVNATYSTATATASSTYIDTGLTATITPKYSTSKILVLGTINGVFKQVYNVAAGIQLLRGSTSICIPSNGSAGYTASSSAIDVGSVSCEFLDSPATTSATTYKFQFACITLSGSPSGNALYVQDSNSTSTICLMEIAG